MTKLRILQTNDMHGRLGDVHLEKLRALRKESDLYFDCGDAIRAGNLAVPLRPEAVWGHLAELDCTASVPGNRESHVLEGAFQAKIAGLGHPLICANMRTKDGGYRLPRFHVLEAAGVKVGVFGVMVPMVTERMASKAVSAFLWDQPIPSAQEVAEELRPQVDLLIALTHIGYKRDLELAEKCPRLDAIFGGHSHTVLEQPEYIGTVAVCQTGAHCHYAGVYEWDGRLAGHLEPL